MPILHWLTREQDLHTARKAPYRLLEQVQTYGAADTRNMLIQGDNLGALKALLPYYAGKVKCVYIDPPYNTKSAFEHYDDNLEHTVWLAMMYPRLELLRELLSEDGSIWVSCDDNEAHYLKVVMDEVFGRSNFIANNVWQKLYTVKNSSRYLSDMHEHILLYSKNREYFNINLIERSEKAISSYKNLDNDPRGPWTTNAVQARNYYSLGSYEIKSPSRKSHFPPKGTFWRISQESFEKLDKENRIWWGASGDSIPRIKKFLSEAKKGAVPATLWFYQDVSTNADAKTEIRSIITKDADIFTTPKPERLIQRILHIATNPDDLVLDSFLGSGTTAAVAHKMGRRYIGIEIGEHALTHCIPRLQKVMDGEQGGISKAVNWQGGGGFRFYRLGEPIFAENGAIRPGITFAQLAAHIWFTETGIPMTTMRVPCHCEDSKAHSLVIASERSERGNPFLVSSPSPLLGIHTDTAYYLLFNGILKDKRAHGGNVLTQKILNSLPPHNGPRVIYGERSLFGTTRLKEWGIINAVRLSR